MRQCSFLPSVLAPLLALLVACQGADASTPSPAAASTAGPGGGGGAAPKGGTETERDTPAAAVNCTGAPGTFYALSAARLGADEEKMCAYEGSVVLIVNGASHCGYTGQYEPLQDLYAKYHDTQKKSFTVLAFPSDSFNQEEDTAAGVSKECVDKFKLTFPLFSIGPVIDIPSKNVQAQPIYKWLAAQPGMSTPIDWNFEKFLIGKDGKVVQRWLSGTSPDAGGEIDKAIEAELAK